MSQKQENSVDGESAAALVETERTQETQLHTAVGIYSMLQLYIIGIAIIIVSTGSRSYYLLHKKIQKQKPQL